MTEQEREQLIADHKTERERLINIACDRDEKVEDLETKLADSEKFLKAARRENEGLRGKLLAQSKTLNETKRQLSSAHNEITLQKQRADKLGRQVQDLSKEMNDAQAAREMAETEVSDDDR